MEVHHRCLTYLLTRWYLLTFTPRFRALAPAWHVLGLWGSLGATAYWQAFGPGELRVRVSCLGRFGLMRQEGSGSDTDGPAVNRGKHAWAKGHTAARSAQIYVRIVNRHTREAGSHPDHTEGPCVSEVRFLRLRAPMLSKQHGNTNSLWRGRESACDAHVDVRRGHVACDAHAFRQHSQYPPEHARRTPQPQPTLQTNLNPSSTSTVESAISAEHCRNSWASPFLTSHAVGSSRPCPALA